MVNRKLILAVDDNRAILEIINKSLQEMFEVCLACSGEEALDILKIRRPDLILLDIDMPRISGFEVIKQIKNTPEIATIPVIFISGADDFENEMMGLNLGGIDYVVKPIIPELLRRRCEQHIELACQNDIKFACLILDNVPFACNLWSLNKRALIYANNAVVNMFKLQDKNELIRNFSDFLPKYQPDGALSGESFNEKLDTAFELGNCDYTWNYLDREGDEVPAWVSLRRLYIKNDPYVVSYIRDLRRDSEAKRVLKDERDRLSSLIEDSPVGVVTITTEKILNLNRTAMQTLNGQPGDAITALFADSGESDGLFRQLGKEGFAHNVLCHFIAKNQSSRRCNVEAKLTEFSGKPAFMLWVTDIEDICACN